MAGRKKKIAGYEVEIWETSFRVEGMSQVVHVGHHINDRVIEDIIFTIAHSLKQKGTLTMNLETLAALVRDDVTTIVVRMKNSDKDFIFLCHKNLAEQAFEIMSTETPSVVVSTRNGLGVGKVTQVHDEPQIDPEDGNEYRWAFQLVDQRLLDRQLKVTAALEDRLKANRKRSRREQALAALGLSPDDVKELTHTAEKEA